MKQIIKYRVLTLVGKLTMDIRLTLDDRIVYETNRDGTIYTNMSMSPMIGISIFRSSEQNSDGSRTRAPWNPNDHLSMTKYSLPIMHEELCGVQQDLKKPELYSYKAKRLELNESLAEKIRRVFMIGTTTVEISAVVIIQPDESRVEGVKLKFNNENSSVLLTLNELNALIFNIDKLDPDALALTLYNTYRNSNNTGNTSSTIDYSKKIDITPKADEFAF